MIIRDFDADHLDDDWDNGPDDDDDDDLTIPCPHCLEPVFEDAERCPECGHYLSREDAPRRKPWWVVAGVIVCLFIVFRWIF